ncbi:PilT/PilU family type 4a pilus ATPase [Egibacter rhizosphaerae]|uniref:PilT/PilU family type 4a pilus ATPase n=1 Tax=Egibacter rhizosphaerae TaxID=1670831 RepID=A0A411YJZ5_9ACTN|nr:PilT/PilU family type 4a pilus ATPase [Egibacter rhizosphaerae]QBI21511.1 PilT/PilU family type 4a pilus ATPase [Egibacter rhizosphaerae]
MTTELGRVLVSRGVVSEEQLRSAVETQEYEGGSLGKVIVDLGYAAEREIVQAVAETIGMPFADTRPGQVDPDAAALMPQDEATRLGALPVGFDRDGSLLVALADPGNDEAVERVKALTGVDVSPALAARGELQQAIAHLADAPGSAPADGGAGARPEREQGEARQRPPGGSRGLSLAERSDAAEASLATEAAPEGADSLLAYEQGSAIDLDEVLVQIIKRGASDLHLTAGVPPMLRLHGELEPMDEFDVLTPPELQKMIYAILTQKQREQFENELELDLSYQVPNVARFRVNVFQQRDSMGAVMRAIPHEIFSIEDLGLPRAVESLARRPRGFVLVTGPTGSGKSTTLASLIDMVNRERSSHIMTIEDPIEFLHTHNRSIVNQRELGGDTHSFSAALKHVLRQDPDVILVGELRDLETIQVALTAAETGHLVFGTLHTQDAPQTIDRMIDVFPPHQQEQIRVQLGGALQGVVCQQLLKTKDGHGRVPATEVMIATSAIKNLIREGKTHQMYSSIQAGKEHGMATMDTSLAQLVKTGKVTYDAALEKCNNAADFNRLCGRA